MISDKTIERINEFNKVRNWEKYHNGKDLSISLAIEATELLEVFQWSGDDLDRKEKIEKIKEELADVFIYAIQISEKYKLDIDEIINKKIDRNAIKYPSNKENKF